MQFDLKAGFQGPAGNFAVPPVEAMTDELSIVGRIIMIIRRI